MPASNPAPRIPTARLLPHVLDATAHGRHLHAAPDATIQLLSTTATSLREAGQLDTARPLLDRALDIAQDDLGPDHPDTLDTRANLAWWLGVAGQPAQAAAQLRDLLTDYLRVLGPDHPSTLAARAHLAYWLGDAGQPAQAAAQSRDLLTDYLRVLGPDHPDTLIARAGLARWLGEAGQPDQAAAQYRDLLTDQLRVLGPDHPHTLTTRDQLAYWEGRRDSDGERGRERATAELVAGCLTEAGDLLSDSGSGTGAARLSELRPGAVTATPTRPATCANVACQALCIALRFVRIEALNGSTPSAPGRETEPLLQLRQEAPHTPHKPQHPRTPACFPGHELGNQCPPEP